MTIETSAKSPSIDASEVEKFSKMAAEWWNPKGKFGVLHLFNPVRLEWIKEQACARFGLDPSIPAPFKGLRLLDIGCGGGLLCEPMAKLGATVVGVDPSEKNIKTALVHAQEGALEIDYRVGTAEDLAAAGEKFDIILNMEVVEHVAGVAARMFKSLADKGINIQAITTSEIKVSVLIDEAYTELAVRALHTAYGLDKA